MSRPQNNPVSQELNRTRNLIKESSDKILKDHINFESQLEALSLSLPHEYKNDLNGIIVNFISMKEYFKTFLSLINSIVHNPAEISTTNSDHSSNTITPRIKSSYDSICAEFIRFENIVREMAVVKTKIASKKKRRIQLLERVLQGHLDEVIKVDFSKITNANNDGGWNVKIDQVSKMISSNNDIMKYDSIDISMTSEVNTLNYELMGNNKENKDNDDDDEEYTEERGSVITELKIDSESRRNSLNNTIVQRLAQIKSIDDENELITQVNMILAEENKEKEKILYPHGQEKKKK